MALLRKVRGLPTLMLAAGASCFLVALWDVSDQTFGSNAPGIFRGISTWSLDTFGHWGPRALLMALGVLLVLSSFRRASVARENDVPSGTASQHAGIDDRRSRTTRFTLLWTPILLVFSLLAFIVVGPLLRNPTIDDVLSYWRERYYALAAFITFLVLLSFVFWYDWKHVRETGDLFSFQGMRILIYVAAAVALALVSWWTIFRIA